MSKDAKSRGATATPEETFCQLSVEYRDGLNLGNLDECRRLAKMSLLGVFAMLSYNAGDDVHGVPASVMMGDDLRSRDGDVACELASLANAPGQSEAAGSEMEKAGILHRDSDGDWYFVASQDRTAAQICTGVIDALIGHGLAVAVFYEAVGRMEMVIMPGRAKGREYQVFRCFLQLIRAYDQIFKNDSGCRSASCWDLPTETETKRGFLALLKSAMRHTYAEGEFHDVLKKRADEVERELPTDWEVDVG